MSWERYLAFPVIFFSAYAAGWLIKSATGNSVGFDILFKYTILAMVSLLLYLVFTGFSTSRLVQEGKHDDLIYKEGIYSAFINARERAANWKL